MARITIEDCIEKVPNRFQLVQMAAIRAKQLKKGARPLLVSEGNKDVVMSLREIAAGLVKPGGVDVGPESMESSPPAPMHVDPEPEASVQDPMADGSSSGI
jgi:DNA-directed RNA polymerase subunit omega